MKGSQAWEELELLIMAMIIKEIFGVTMQVYINR